MNIHRANPGSVSSGNHLDQPADLRQIEPDSSVRLSTSWPIELGRRNSPTSMSQEVYRDSSRARSQLRQGPRCQLRGAKLASLLAVAFLAPQAYAQTAPAEQKADTSAASNKPTETSKIEAVVVSGSRIDRTGFIAPTPTLHVDAEQLTQGARDNVAAALNDIPQFRASLSAQTTGTTINGGSAPVDLRGLGTSRTLVLVDGRRFTSDNDLNVIPTVLIKGVDVVTGGASAAWGSGAVSGVVNIMLDRSFTGAKFGAQYGQSSFSDARQRRFEAAYGTPFAGGRGSFVIGAEYLNNEGVAPKTTRPNVGRWRVLPNGSGAFVNTPNVGDADISLGGLVLDGVLMGQAFNPDGSLSTFQGGTTVGYSAIGSNAPSTDDITPLVAPQRRYATMASVVYDITDNLTLTADIRHSRMWNSYLFYVDSNYGDLTIKSDNAFLSNAVRTAMQNAGESSFTMGRFNSDMSANGLVYDRPNTQATVALDGRFGKNWRWSTYYSQGKSEINFSIPGQLLTKEYAQAVDSVRDPVTGNPICRVSLSDPSNRCVPVNLFGFGAPSQAAIDYVTGAAQQWGKTTLNVGGASVRGEPWGLPAGDVSIAAGFEARREKIDVTVGPDDTAQAFLTYNNSPMAGSFVVKEAFSEVLVPIVRDLPGLHKLELNAAARVSDYDTTGNIWSWKLGVTNEFAPGFIGRITQSRDIRSANLTERFATTQIGYSYVNDPVTGQSGNIKTVGGGNSGLLPETADTLTFGMTFTPSRSSGLNMSLDYFRIKIDDVISRVGAVAVLSRCQNGNAALCARVTRDANGAILSIDSTYINLARYKTDGFDAEISYSTPLNRIFSDAPGRLQLRAVGTLVRSLTTDDGVSKMEYVRSQNDSWSPGVPRFRAMTSAKWQGDVFGAGLRLRYISAGDGDRTSDIVNNHIGAYTYADLNLSAKLPVFRGYQAELYATVTNLGDKSPPPGSMFSPYYDVIGRYITVGARLAF